MNMPTEPSVELAFATSICGQCHLHHIDEEDDLDREINAKQARPPASQPWLDSGNVRYK